MVNARVNYLIKEALNNLVDARHIDLENDETRFCVSWVVIQVCFCGTNLIHSFNNRRIPGNHKDSFLLCMLLVYFSNRKG